MEASMLRMKKALGMYSLADVVEDTNGNGVVYIVMMTVALFSLNLIMKHCDEAETGGCLTHYEVKGGQEIWTGS